MSPAGGTKRGRGKFRSQAFRRRMKANKGKALGKANAYGQKVSAVAKQKKGPWAEGQKPVKPEETPKVETPTPSTPTTSTEEKKQNYGQLVSAKARTKKGPWSTVGGKPAKPGRTNEPDDVKSKLENAANGEFGNRPPWAGKGNQNKGRGKPPWAGKGNANKGRGRNK